jgi:hypothetical protein
MIRAALDTFGGLDVLHNNATDSATNAIDIDIATLDMAVFDRLICVNLKGVVMGCKHAIPPMLARGGGSIVNTASIEASMARGVRAVYGATKAGVVQFTSRSPSSTGPEASAATPSPPASHLLPPSPASRPSRGPRRSASIPCPGCANLTSPTLSSSWRLRRPGTSTATR